MRTKPMRLRRLWNEGKGGGGWAVSDGMARFYFPIPIPSQEQFSSGSRRPLPSFDMLQVVPFSHLIAFKPS